MNSLKLYTFNRPVPAERFDCCFRYFLIQELEKKYKVEWFNLSGDDNFIYENEGDTYKFYDGSTALIEMENKKIKLLDFGDCPISTLNISKFKNFQMSAIAHYNPKLWNNDTRMKSGILYETNWEFGKTNSNEVVEFRKNIELNNKLYWLGTIYKNTGIDRYDGCRDSIPLISKFLRDKFSFNPNRLPFDQYILECCRHKLILGFGGGGGYTCGDFCLRDVELFGLEIPMIRPKFNIETIDPLIPDFHYISVNIDDCLLPNFRIKKECEEEVANRIAIKYLEVINNDTLLKYVAENSKNWYDKNMTYPNVINTVIKVLEL